LKNIDWNLFDLKAHRQDSAAGKPMDEHDGVEHKM
jgi:hypothetical protein